jgi:hypothetical protein
MCSVDNQPRYVKLFGGGDGIGIDGHGAAGGHETRIAESDEADADEEEAARRRAEEETRTDAEERKRDEEERRREEKRRKEERYVPCARARAFGVIVHALTRTTWRTALRSEPSRRLWNADGHSKR